MTSSFPVTVLILWREVEWNLIKNEFEWTRRNVTNDICSWQFCKQNPLLTQSFWKMFLIGRNFTSVPRIFSWWTFDLLLNDSSRHFLFEVWFLTASKKIIISSLHQTNIVRKNILQRKQTINTFSLVLEVDFKESFLFFNAKLELLLNSFKIKFFIFLDLNSYYVCACRGMSLNRFIKKHLFLKLALIVTTHG